MLAPAPVYAHAFYLRRRTWDALDKFSGFTHAWHEQGILIILIIDKNVFYLQSFPMTTSHQKLLKTARKRRLLIVKGLKSGQRVVDIAQKCGISRQRIYQIRNEENLKMRRRASNLHSYWKRRNKGRLP